ncbi:MAG: DEAD/DEAH box helicase, partial [Streptomycetales bacterium]
PHPFAAGADELRRHLTGPDPDDLLPGARAGELALLLPSGKPGPLPSPELVRDPGNTPEVDSPRTLTPWLVPTLRLYAQDGLEMLLRAAEERADAVPGAVPGASLRFLAETARLATDLVGGGRVLPALAPGDGAHVAWWRAVPGDGEQERLRLLARAMPPVCRAEHTRGRSEGRAAGEVLLEAVDALAEAAARRALKRAGTGKGPHARVRGASTPERWLAALAAGDGRFEADPDEVAELHDELDAWHEAADSLTGSVRVCFRLLQPPDEEPEGSWVLEFLLQAADDPSLVVPAAEVWQAGGTPTAFTRRIDYPQEALLGGLGRASRLYPELERELRASHPQALDLDAQDAHHFLRTAAPMLSQAGFGVLLPSWWGRPAGRLGARLTARSPQPANGAVVSQRLGMEQLLDYRWDLALGDEPLTEEELAELAGLKVPLVRLRGQWVELDPDRLAAGLDLLERGRTGEMRAGEVLQAALHPDEVMEGGLPVLGVHAEGWLGDLLSGGLEHRLEPVTTPAGFEGTLRPYQQRGLAWLSYLGELGLGACLADDMGLGKTPQTLAVLATDRAAGTLGPTLLVCPMSVVGNWQREVERFTPGLRAYVHHGADRRSGEELAAAAGQADLVITTYALAARDREDLSGVEWRRVVLDEAQNIKNSGSRQSQAVRALRAPQKVALTGTPVENRLSELWSIMDFLNPGLLGSARGFRARFAVPIERRGDDEAAELLKRVTGPFVLRRLKTDRLIIGDLPDKLEMKVYCNLTIEQASLYQAVVDDMLARIEQSEGIERKGLVLATMVKLKQVCNHPGHLLRDGSRVAGRSGKLARLEETLEEVLAEGEKVLCFTQFAEFGELLRAYLAGRSGREVLYLHGGTPKRARDAMVERFQDPGGPPIFVLSLKAGGTGLNLTAANHVIHVDRWWNPAVEDQATDRAFRIGQRRDVQVRKFVCVGTVEERIDTMIEEKRALAERIVGTGEDWLTGLSVDQLRDVVALSSDAVSE